MSRPYSSFRGTPPPKPSHNHQGWRGTGLKNAYGILPLAFLNPIHFDALIGVASDYKNTIFIGCDVPDVFKQECPKTKAHSIPLSLQEDVFSDIQAAIANEMNDVTTAKLCGFHPDVNPSLTACGNYLRAAIDLATDAGGTYRYPQSLLCVGPHAYIATWLRSVLRKQLKACFKNQRHGFDLAVNAIEQYEPRAGYLHFETLAHTKSGQITFSFAG